MASPPANDACQDALPIGNGQLSATLVDATEDGASFCDGPGASPDVWFAYTSLVEARIFVSTAGSAFDTVLSVHTGCPGTRNNDLSCNDNFYGAGGEPSQTSRLDFNPIAGETYWIRVAGYNGSSGPIQLEVGPGGGISGTVTDELTGEPLSGITISGSVRTDLAGRYSLTDLPPGLHTLRFEGNATFLPEVYDDQPCFPNRCHEVETATQIEVRIGELVEDIDFALARAGAVTGRITDAATGEPLGNTRVVLQFPEAGYSWTERTDGNGAYSFRGLPGGTYFVWTESLRAYRNEVYDDVPCDGPYQSCDPSLGAPIVVEGGATTEGIDFALDRFGGAGGRITDAVTGLPIAFASVGIFSLDGGYGASGDADEDGFYTTEGVPPGTYLAIAHGTDYQSELYEGQPCPGGNCDHSLGTSFAVELGAVTPGIDFTLSPLGTIAGRVTDAGTGQPLSFPRVCLYDVEYGFPIYRDVSTDADGRYETEPLETGSYFIGTCEESLYQDEVYDDIPCVARECDPTVGTPIAVEPEQVISGIDFALERLGSISGMVTHATTGEAIPTEVKARTADGTAVGFGFSEAFDPNFTIHLYPGTYYITAESHDFEDELYDDLPCHLGQCDLTQGVPITIALGEEVNGIDFALEPRLFGALSGTVRRRDGVPLSVYVELRNANGRYQSRYSEDDGTFTFSNLEPGTYYVGITGEYEYFPVLYDGIPCVDFCDFTTGTPIEVSTEETIEGIDFVLDELPSLSGQAYDAVSGELLTNVNVELFDAEGQYLGGAGTYGDGSYAIDRILPGVYFAVASSARHLPQLYDGLPCPPNDCDPTTGTPITLELGETVSGVDFRLTTGGSLSGSLFDLESRQTLEGELTLWDQTGSEVAMTYTDGFGRFFFGSLPAGTYYVGARAFGRYLDEIYEDVPCPDHACDPTTGTAIEVELGGETSGIDFLLLPLSGQPCTPSATTLCLNGGRFKVTARWQDPAGMSGDATARMLTGDSGYFWFFTDDNVELIVKLLDACFAPYDRFWFFAAGLTDLGVELTVTDTSTDEVRTYTNATGDDFLPILDTGAFETCPGSQAGELVSSTDDRARRPVVRRAWPSPVDAPKVGACQPGPTVHCLGEGRFQVEAFWSAPGGQSGQGRAALALDATGFYWFFGPDNIELVVKVLDACELEPFNSFWVFAAGLTDVDVTLRVTDTVSGVVREYHNPQGTPFLPVQDTRAFATCDL